MSLVTEFNDYRARMNERILATDNKVIKRFWSLDNQTYQEGALDVRTKEMLGLVASMVLGAKQKRDFGTSGRARFFYGGGLRIDYTLSTNIDDLSRGNPSLSIFYPSVAFMNRWMVGFTISTGIEFKLKELIGGELKLSIQPDVTPQYNQPSIGNVIDPFNPGTVITISERRIRNAAVELGIGLRLLRKVEYVD